MGYFFIHKADCQKGKLTNQELILVGLEMISETVTVFWKTFALDHEHGSRGPRPYRHDQPPGLVHREPPIQPTRLG